jgi:hypothetical protein
MTSPPAVQEAEAPRRRVPWLIVAAVAVAFLLIAGVVVRSRGGAISPPTPEPAANSSTPAALAVTGVFIEPGDGRAPLLDEIEAARQSIDLEVYIVSDKIILGAAAAARTLFLTASRTRESRSAGETRPSASRTSRPWSSMIRWRSS